MKEVLAGGVEEGVAEGAQGYVPVQWTRKKIALAVAIGAVVAALSLGCAAALYVHTIDLALTGGMDAEQQDELAEALQPPKPKRAASADSAAAESAEPESSAYYVAILGCDARPHETIARSDVTMLARIDTEEGTVHLISVPRDMMVEIDGHGTQKINAALAFGGPAGAVRSLSAFAGVPITHYVELRFEQLVELVDRLGGVTVNVPEGFTSDTSGITLATGEQTLNGEQALAFARERHAVSSGDFSRAAAQRTIIKAIADEVLAAPPTEMPSLVGSLASCVTTDYTVAELADAALALKDSGLTVYSAACPSYSFGQNGISYVGTMYDEWRTMMQRVDAGLDPADESAEVPEPQASDEELGAATNARSPRDYAGRVDQAGFKDN
ncbi:LCP family protein [Adlercreutzia sp. R25]|uniref:LCP family protein n=1 Tax=Adlercreutzia shanghongiae TaxID=3111773 RepID=A0ABU6J0L7_9ACTN|nr:MULTISPECIES: LCP family protein [unclassified Adlercreutzia]MEC4273280.1 LCP family protein [Adlercreutzia sp. R25]MEC4295513.1 LCP family protein [Adlercreutzia sp. R22]